MSFQNTQVDLNELPAAEHLLFEPLAPAYVREVLTQSVILWSVLLGLSVLPMWLVPEDVPFEPYLVWLPLPIACLGVLFSWIGVLAAHAKGLALRDHDIAFRSGLIWRKTILLAFSRIQHIELSSGPLQRRYGLASLKFFTAGGLNVDMRIDGLRRDEAEQLRSAILARVARD